jgi:PAS domain S-box-containing protein
MPAKKASSKAAKRTVRSYSRKKRETQLLIEQAALYRLSVALNRETEMQAVMDAAVSIAAELFNVELAAIALVDEGGSTYSGRANVGWSPEVFSFAQRIPLDSNNGLSYAIRHQTVVAISDELNETRWEVPQWALQMGIRSALIAPMIVADKVIGGLVVNDRKTREWSKDDERLIALVANNTAQSLERANLLERLRENQHFIQRVAEASQNLIYVYDLIEARSTYFNRNIATMLGYADEKAEMMEVLSALPRLMHPDDLKQYPRWIGRYATLGNREILETEYRLKHANGEWRWFMSHSMIFERAADGAPRKIIGAAHDITERKHAAEKLKASDDRLREFLNATPDALIIVNKDGRIILVNQQAEKVFGYASGELIDETLEILISERFRASHVAHRADFFAHPRARSMGVGLELHALHRDGSEFPVEISLSHHKVEDDVVVLSSIRDITERKRLELQQNRLATALEAAGEIIVITDANAKIQYVNPAFEYFTGYTRDEALGQTPNMLQSGKHGKEFYRDMWDALMKSDAWHGVVTDKKKNGDLFEAEQTIAPILDTSGETLGYVAIWRDITERARRERELEAIAQLSAAFRTAPALADMMPLLLDQLIDLLKVDSASLIMCDRVNGDLVVEAIRGVPILEVGNRLEAGKGVAGYVIENGQPYLSQDLEKDPHFARRMMIHGQWAAAFTPLATREQIIGALCIARQSTSISHEDLRLLNTIGELAANTIHRASLYEQTRRRLEQLSTLHNIDRAISSSFDLRLTLNIVLDELAQYAGVGAATVLFLNPHLMVLEYAAERGFPRHLAKEAHLNINGSHAGRAVLENQSVTADLTTSKGFAELDALAKEGFTRYDGVPLIAKGKIRGVLEVFSHPSLGAEPIWVEFLETVANRLALAIDNMELFNGLQRSNSELELAYDATLEGWSRALDLRDKETEGHTRRVTEMTLHLAHAMNIEATEITQIRRGALLHDIGKLGVSDRILLKPGPLTDEEWELMRKHPQYAHDLLSPIPFLTPALAIPFCHHEKWDGSGYPRGLKGDAIPLAARIFAVADVWDALRSDRPYRKGWDEAKVREHIREESGKHFDPKVVEVFLELGD